MQRLGHAAVFTPIPESYIDWYSDNLGFKPSELIHAGDRSAYRRLVHASRSRRGLDRSPHVAPSSAPQQPGVDHVSFECRDFDDVGMGHMAMLDKGYKHRWGIGRHFHGSQIL